ncbi:cytochrome P450 [Dacryopinax primogenitus]|uniref:Cytochrome P450 n=1 Tax=Dacryopinax primogenitus (strain DJM 731) TaxID=1858805 RepID=M5FSK2_DACPD|nr:cytochrome P450 [Dacryopinax primogenitus]EJU00436.1 cytochrome P450 [Dacryopinax primogenitus]
MDNSPAGTHIIIPVEAINTSSKLWGPNAREFRPERWLEGGKDETKNGLAESASSISGRGHQKVLTFGDGPRICLGKSFALVEMKCLLSKLVRQFVFTPVLSDVRVGEWEHTAPSAFDHKRTVEQEESRVWYCVFLKLNESNQTTHKRTTKSLIVAITA